MYSLSSSNIRWFTRFACAALMAYGLFSCKGGDRDASLNPEEAAVPSAYRENDSFPESLLPAEITFWMGYYASMDTSVRAGNFKASGVVLHFGPLEQAASGDFGLLKDFYPLMAFSPDSSRVIDWISYNHLIDTNSDGGRKLVGGEADQQVDLRVPGKGVASQLMFNGPQTSVESGAWLTRDAFLLGMIQSDENNKTFTPELMLFNLKDSTFTNFRLNKSIPDSLAGMKTGDFTEAWLGRKNFK
jgi:hypothetical protein